MEFEEQPYHYRSEVSNEPNDNTANIIFSSQSRFESFGAHNPKLRPLRGSAPTLSCISATCPTVDMLCISSVCITPSYRLQKTSLYNRLATFPLRLGSGNPLSTSSPLRVAKKQFPPKGQILMSRPPPPCRTSRAVESITG